MGKHRQLCNVLPSCPRPVLSAAHPRPQSPHSGIETPEGNSDGKGEQYQKKHPQRPSESNYFLPDDISKASKLGIPNKDRMRHGHPSPTPNICVIYIHIHIYTYTYNFTAVRDLRPSGQRFLASGMTGGGSGAPRTPWNSTHLSHHLCVTLTHQPLKGAALSGQKVSCPGVVGIWEQRQGMLGTLGMGRLALSWALHCTGLTGRCKPRTHLPHSHSSPLHPHQSPHLVAPLKLKMQISCFLF